jgi:putative membrane protein
MTVRTASTLALIVCWGSAGAAFARGLSPQEFVHKAAAAGMAEVELGQLASNQGSSDAVKQFGQQMVRDHSAADDKLKQLAQQQNITLPTALPPDKQSTADMLRRKSGTAFDRAYAAQMVRDHEKAVGLFRTAAADNQLPEDLRRYAKDTLPTLEHHLQEAQQLNDDVRGGQARSTSHRSRSH